MSVYLWLNNEGWERFGPFGWLTHDDLARLIRDQEGRVVAAFDGGSWQTPGPHGRRAWRSWLITGSPRHPFPHSGEPPRPAGSREYTAAVLGAAPDPAAAVATALRYRGFLLDTTGGTAALSDNAHEGDAEDLDLCLAAAGLEVGSGCGWASGVDLARLSPPPGRAVEGVVDAILNWRPRLRLEAGYPRHRDGWEWFGHRDHGVKVRAADLEPGVAFLVKAYNAAGAATWCSCSGHDPAAPARVDFSGGYFAVWARFVHDLLGVPAPGWRWEGASVVIGAAAADDLLARTAEAAEAIYAARVVLRAFRRRVIDGWPPGRSAAPPSPADLCHRLRDEVLRTLAP